ncbi:MAG: glycosyltransferase family 4 protein [Hydrotalea sp.]|nr:glycosyltransferase family 4 protein [Hydrotalea sp.]
MKSILIISNIIPFPLNEGGKISQYYFIEQLKDKVSLTYILPIFSNEDLLNAKQLQLLHPEIQFKLFIDINKLSIKNRVSSYLRSLISLMTKKYKNKKSNYEYIFQIHAISKSNFKFINDCFNSQKYDIIQVEFPWSLNVAPILPSNTRKIFVQHEPQSKRYIKSFYQPSSYQKYVAELIMNCELSYMKYFDKTVVFNKQDYNLYENKIEHLEISPFGIPKALKVKHSASTFFNKFLFLGNESHEPNKQGLSDFLDNYFLPNLNSIKYPIYISGTWSKEFKKKYSIIENIKFLGFVKNIEHHYDNSILIVPIISGGGIRVKILQAFENNIPVISTSFAAEGLYSENDKNHLLLYDNLDDFKDHLTHLHNNFFMRELALLAKKYVTVHFNTQDLLNKRLSLYEI